MFPGGRKRARESDKDCLRRELKEELPRLKLGRLRLWKEVCNYIENRRAWAKRVDRDLEIPNHFCFDEHVGYPSAEAEVAGCKALTDTVDALAHTYSFIVIDTPGHEAI